jgi:hypothetical protein
LCWENQQRQEPCPHLIICRPTSFLLERVWQDHWEFQQTEYLAVVGSLAVKGSHREQPDRGGKAWDAGLQ